MLENFAFYLSKQDRIGVLDHRVLQRFAIIFRRLQAPEAIWCCFCLRSRSLYSSRPSSLLNRECLTWFLHSRVLNSLKFIACRVDLLLNQIFRQVIYKMSSYHETLHGISVCLPLCNYLKRCKEVFDLASISLLRHFPAHRTTGSSFQKIDSSYSYFDCNRV